MESIEATVYVFVYSLYSVLCGFMAKDAWESHKEYGDHIHYVFVSSILSIVCLFLLFLSLYVYILR